MDHDSAVHEDAYYADDGDEAFEGMDLYVGGDSAPRLLGSRRGDDDDDDDDEYIDEEEEEDGDRHDAQLDAEDALDAIQELDAGHGGPVNVSQFLQHVEHATQELHASTRRRNESVGLINVVSANRILSLFRTRSGLDTLHIFGNDRNRDDEEPFGDDDYGEPRLSGRALALRAKGWWKKPYTEPQPAGFELLMSGEFGRIGPKTRYRNLARRLRERTTWPGRMPKEDLCENLVPNSPGTVVASYPASVYCGQFSADSSFYYVCRKDFNLHIYDMTAPRSREKHPVLYSDDSGQQTTMKVHKSLKGIPEGWTITDSHLSPDNERLIYSSMSSTVYMTKTLEYDSTQIPINFSDTRGSRSGTLWGWDDDSYCIWSCRFSADGNEVIAGGRGKIFVYDLVENRRTVKISAHDDDVNSCCWADYGSNVLISASDDTFLKIWDRRSLGSSTRPSGVLIGHTEGITNVSAKGDGRYVISNGKDQALRLWDLRKMRSNANYEAVKNDFYGLDGFDYRYQDERMQRRPAHPQDCSVMTYRGHTVMRTLIRCHFSPAESTGSSYIYSGSSDGRVHIWSLDGRVVQVLDRSKTYPISFDPSEPELADTHGRRAGGSCVRDVSWHSREPVMLSAAWGSHGSSSVARHEWKGLSKMGGRLEDWVEKHSAEAKEQQQQGISERTPLRRSTRVANQLPGAYVVDEDDDEYVDTDEYL